MAFPSVSGLRSRDKGISLSQTTVSPGPLALLGGTPAFDRLLHVGRPNLGRREQFAAYVDEMFERRWLSNGGPLVQRFEQQLEAHTGAKHCIALCNGTLALELMIRAAGLTGEVIVPSFTFIATVHALRMNGITPIFCDVDPESHNLDPREVEKHITPRTSGILGVHLWGRPCDVDALQSIADTHNLSLLFDAAHAFGTAYRGQMIGTLGDAETFSFHATKFVNSFEGGAVATNDDLIAARVRQDANFGYGPDDTIEGLGTNAKMTEVCAAMGLTSLDSMPDIIATNRRHYNTYRECLSNCDFVTLIDYDATDARNYQYIILDVEPHAPLTRDELLSMLKAENVLARRYFYPGCHRVEPYRSEQPTAGRHLPVTEQLSDRVLALPTGTAVDATDIRVICDRIRTAFAAAPAVRDALRPVGFSSSPDNIGGARH